MDIWKSRVQETLIRPENNLTICLKQILIPNGTTKAEKHEHNYRLATDRYHGKAGKARGQM